MTEMDMIEATWVPSGETLHYSHAETCTLTRIVILKYALRDMFEIFVLLSGMK